jgi:site-specific recombinase XerD
MIKNKDWHEQVDIINTLKLREQLESLPPFARTFFRSIEHNTTSRTRIAYAYDLQVFFAFAVDNIDAFRGRQVQELTLDMLDSVKLLDLENYMDYLKYYHCKGKADWTRVNQERGIMRKMSSLKSFYHYFYRKEMIKTDPAALVVLPKIREKEIVRLDVDEVARLLDEAESGEKLSGRQKAFHERTKTRDMAILTLFLGTGIRVSELVGLDLDDVDFRNAGIHIHRKGGKEVVVYFGDEVEEALVFYEAERRLIQAQKGHENAFFLSLQKKRMSVRSVENLVKKYAATVTTLKNITPHKLRSTYGTSLYQETGDIYLVADVLGHSDINTTRRHYAAIEDQHRRMARNKVRLRESDNEQAKQ